MPTYGPVNTGHKYSAGQEVVLIPLEEAEKIIGAPQIIPRMRGCFGKTAKIAEPAVYHSNNLYHLDIDNGMCVWDERWLTVDTASGIEKVIRDEVAKLKG